MAARPPSGGGRLTPGALPVDLRPVKRRNPPLAYAELMDRWIDALPWLVTALGLVIAAAALMLGALVWWLRHPVEDRSERE